MEAEDVIQLPNCGSDSGSEGDEACKLNRDDDGVEGPMGNGESNLGRIKDDPELEQGQLMSELEITRDVDLVETAETRVLDYVALSVETGGVNDFEVEEGQVTPEMESGKNVGEETTEFTENVAQVEGKIGDVPSENGCVTDREAQTSSSCLKTDGGSISGVKRTRATSEDEQPSVHVKYYGLSRHSKRKLEQLLREWSPWSARTGSRLQDQDEASESGEDIYFPALDVGTGKLSTVTHHSRQGQQRIRDRSPSPPRQLTTSTRRAPPGPTTSSGPTSSGPTIPGPPRHSSACYLCKKARHPGRNCDGSPVVCYTCGLPGHYSTDCTRQKINAMVAQRERTLMGPNRCDSCGELGHYSPECPRLSPRLRGHALTAPPKTPTGQTVCGWCRGMGHAASECPQLKAYMPDVFEQDRPDGQTVCGWCRGMGHAASECPRLKACMPDVFQQDRHPDAPLETEDSPVRGRCYFIPQEYADEHPEIVTGEPSDILDYPTKDIYVIERGQIYDD